MALILLYIRELRETGAYMAEKPTGMTMIGEPERVRKGRNSFETRVREWSLILGDRDKPKIKKLRAVLRRYFSRVEISRDLLEVAPSSLLNKPALVVVTDDIDGRLDVISRMRILLPEAGFMALFEWFTPETERSLRCVGTLFLGSYETFFAFSGSIVESLLNRKRESWKKTIEF